MSYDKSESLVVSPLPGQLAGLQYCFSTDSPTHGAPPYSLVYLKQNSMDSLVYVQQNSMDSLVYVRQNSMGPLVYVQQNSMGPLVSNFPAI
jgi:hypothetical protein